ncbi:unnamed protein product, partial [Closterium sp. Yama58-4]
AGRGGGVREGGGTSAYEIDRIARAAALGVGGGVGWWSELVERWWRGRGREEGAVVDEGGGRRCVVLLTCEDTGCGIAEEEQHDVFQTFMQAHQKRHAHGGGGMSLHLSRQLVSLLGGSMGLLSTEGVGTTLHVALPFDAEGAGAVEGPGEKVVSAKEALKEMLQGMAILVVDDNPINRRVAASTLARYGAEVALAESGEAALRLLQARHSFRLVLMDLHMPTLDGFQTTARLRALEAAAYAARGACRGGSGVGSSGGTFMWLPCQQMWTALFLPVPQRLAWMVPCRSHSMRECSCRCSQH